MHINDELFFVHLVELTRGGYVDLYQNDNYSLIFILKNLAKNLVFSSACKTLQNTNKTKTIIAVPLQLLHM